MVGARGRLEWRRKTVGWLFSFSSACVKHLLQKCASGASYKYIYRLKIKFNDSFVVAWSRFDPSVSRWRAFSFAIQL
jgi:hypothetical protein